MSNQFTTFESLIAAVVSDFESEGSKTSSLTERAYFEHLGQKFGLSVKAIKGIWDSWEFRQARGLGMFDQIMAKPNPLP